MKMIKFQFWVLHDQQEKMFALLCSFHSHAEFRVGDKESGAEGMLDKEKCACSVCSQKITFMWLSFHHPSDRFDAFGFAVKKEIFALWFAKTIFSAKPLLQLPKNCQLQFAAPTKQKQFSATSPVFEFSNVP